ncbi:hypothetical protein OIO90_000291 [Microbotryomycetes sp. JL221]|nr:hypothetical protein OIO90_000291 [Microbotryomycetes sp. JL221]
MQQEPLDRPAESLYFSTVVPPRLAILNDADIQAYLDRLNLSSSELLNVPPSFELLSKLMMAAHTSIPYDTSSLHVKEEVWNGPDDVDIKLGTGSGMQLHTKSNFDRIVNKHRGGFCYALNHLFGSLLRGLNFRTSEVGTRVYLHRGKDPAEVGYWWSSITHELLIVDWPGSDGRFVCDVGFGGGGCPRPIRLQDGATSASLSLVESFYLKAEDLPTGNCKSIMDPAPGYTIYRRVCPRGRTVKDATSLELEDGEFWTPCVHFTLQTISPDDILMSTHYNETHPKAPFVNFFVVSLLLPSGARRTLSYGPPPIDMQEGNEEEAAGRRMAKLYTKNGIKGEEFDVDWIPFKVGPMKTTLQREYGFKF